MTVLDFDRSCNRVFDQLSEKFIEERYFQFGKAFMRPKIFVTRLLPEPAMKRLAEFCEIEVGTDKGILGRQALLSGVREVDGLISLITDNIDSEVMEAGPGLRVIANVGVGYNNVDIASAQQKGILVTNTPDVLTDATADLTWGLILSASRRIVEADAFVRAGKFDGWDLNMMLGMGLTGKALGIIGYGRIGRAVARRAVGFGMSVIYCTRDDIAFRDDPQHNSLVMSRQAAMRAGSGPLNQSARIDGLSPKRVTLDQLLEWADIVTLHVPLAATTQHLIDSASFNKMKPTAYLINTSRGQIVDEAALVDALKNHKIGGAGLDVYEKEPQITPELLTLNNAVLLPHIGSATRETRIAMALLAVENACDALAGRAPRNQVS